MRWCSAIFLESSISRIGYLQSFWRPWLLTASSQAKLQAPWELRAVTGSPTDPEGLHMLLLEASGQRKRPSGLGMGGSRPPSPGAPTISQRAGGPGSWRGRSSKRVETEGAPGPLVFPQMFTVTLRSLGAHLPTRVNSRTPKTADTALGCSFLFSLLPPLLHPHLPLSPNTR